MKCPKAERLILRSLDGLLKPEEKAVLEDHLRGCPACLAKEEDYREILAALRVKDLPEARPYFWERLQPKLKEKHQFEPLTLWKQLSLRAIPVSLFVVILLASALLLFSPPQKEELSPSGALLLHNTNPLQETNAVFEEENIENKNMMVIFTALAEKNDTRRQFP